MVEDKSNINYTEKINSSVFSEQIIKKNSFKNKNNFILDTEKFFDFEIFINEIHKKFCEIEKIFSFNSQADCKDIKIENLNVLEIKDENLFDNNLKFTDFVTNDFNKKS